MIATHNQQTPKGSLSLHTSTDIPSPSVREQSPLLLLSKIVTHNPQAGINPLVDAASYLFSVVGKLKQLKHYRQVGKLQKELIHEINSFQEAVKNLNYNAEYIVVCRYLLCATLDDIISHTTWGGQGKWETYSLLSAFKQQTNHHDKFFNILERALKDPILYIEMMELIYLCLSLGYKGQYRNTEHSQYQLEQITNNLYKHIQAYRGNVSKSLSPAPLKTFKGVRAATERKSNLLFITILTASVIMAIFISLGYLMDVISNEAFKNIKQIAPPPSDHATKL